MALDPRNVVQSTHGLVYTSYKLAGRADQLPIPWGGTYTHTLPRLFRSSLVKKSAGRLTESCKRQNRRSEKYVPVPNVLLPSLVQPLYSIGEGSNAEK